VFARFGVSCDWFPISNQATLRVSIDVNGSNEANALCDYPSQPGNADQTGAFSAPGTLLAANSKQSID